MQQLMKFVPRVSGLASNTQRCFLPSKHSAYNSKNIACSYSSTQEGAQQKQIEDLQKRYALNESQIKDLEDINNVIKTRLDEFTKKNDDCLKKSESDQASRYQGFHHSAKIGDADGMKYNLSQSGDGVLKNPLLKRMALNKDIKKCANPELKDMDSSSSSESGFNIFNIEGGPSFYMGVGLICFYIYTHYQIAKDYERAKEAREKEERETAS